MMMMMIMTIMIIDNKSMHFKFNAGSIFHIGDDNILNELMCISHSSSVQKLTSLNIAKKMCII